MEAAAKIHGGEFLIKDTGPDEMFIPEEFNEEQLMIARTFDEFLEAEVLPNLDRIDAAEEGLMASLLKQAGEMGMLGVAVPEAYGGFGQSFLTVMRASESVGASNSFSVAFMAHIGIGTLPLLYYGSDEQKQKYIPKLASGEMLASYCLTEPDAGSDANAGKTKAVLSEDGKHYILNGQKMWITNGGFADLLTVFAKIDNDRVLSAFLVESGAEGVSMSPEEKKMGIKGSSTVQIFLNDAKVPVENLLGKRGGGFRIALSILHNGRIKLGANVIGMMKRVVTHTVNYANERKQFGSLISSFGAIKYKLAEQVIQAFVSESAVYRASKDIDDAISRLTASGSSYTDAQIGGVSEFAVECALLKVLGSEALDYIVDEAVQVHGGMGYSALSEVERAYRDSRINRIFEGTNEINRLLLIETAIKKSMKGDYDLFGPAEQVRSGGKGNGTEAAGWLGEKKQLISGFKKAALMMIGKVYEMFKGRFVHEQQIMMNIADMVMYLYAAESAAVRAEKIGRLKGDDAGALYRDMVDVYVYDTAHKLFKSGSDAINALLEGEERKQYLSALRDFTTAAAVNTKDARTRIADKLIEENRYCF
ncbi:MAG: acyl-CoA dehydrogenase family protein [Flavobacteriales bacterium]